MSMLPYYFDDYYHPTRLVDQQFGLGITPDEILTAALHCPRGLIRSRDYYRPWSALSRVAKDSGSTVTVDKDKFQVALDVQQFAPSEINVKTMGNQVVIEGKHEEKEDEHGHISRHFVRKYTLPKDHHAEDVVSSLSTDGVLTITAPKRRVKGLEGERMVPIQATGSAHKAISKQEDSSKMQE